MRILAILSRIPYPTTDGGAILTYSTLKFLHEAGHDVCVLALNTKKHYQPPEVLEGICTRFRTVEITTDITPWGALWNLLTGKSYIANRFSSSLFAQELENILRTERVDVIHFDHTLVAQYAETALHADLVHLPRPPIVLRTHNVEYIIQERLATHETTALRRWYRRHEAHRMKAYERRYFSLCDGIIAITPEDAAEVRRMGYEGALEVVPAGVDIHEFSPNASVLTLPHSLCYIGGMDWMPNVEAMHWFVSNVMPLVRKDLPEMTFHLAGKRMPPDVQAYRQQQCVFTYPDVPSAPVFLQSHEILVVPLLSGGGMRLKIIEAMALGMPIISTRIGAEGIEVRDGESILFAETPEEFVRAMRRLHDNPALKKRLGEEARRIALERYTWEAVVAKQMRFYESLLPRL
jgi:glycosyltransferase involved in cell wall biosynthesis